MNLLSTLLNIWVVCFCSITRHDTITLNGDIFTGLTCRAAFFFFLEREIQDIIEQKLLISEMAGVPCLGCPESIVHGDRRSCDLEGLDTKNSLHHLSSSNVQLSPYVSAADTGPAEDNSGLFLVYLLWAS